MRSIVMAAALAVATWAGGHAQAATCPGEAPFTDVSSSASYCSNVEWLANRNITTGCDATHFCPDQAVTRAQMALFMNRLANAMVEPPILALSQFGALSLTTSALSNLQCPAVVPLSKHPRTLVLSADVSIAVTGATATVGMLPAYSFDGATWNTLGAYSPLMTSGGAAYGNMSISVSTVVPANTDMHLALALFASEGTVTTQGGARCHLLAQLQSRSGSASPFDR